MPSSRILFPSTGYTGPAVKPLSRSLDVITISASTELRKAELSTIVSPLNGSLPVGLALRPSVPTSEVITVKELIAKFYQYAQSHYRKNGKSTGTAEGFRPALRPPKKMYGGIRVSDFGPKSLKTLQQAMIKDGLSRRYINDNIERIRRVFRWGVSEELVPVSVFRGLGTVAGLAKGRSGARETAPIGPVSDHDVEATLPFLPPIVADMVKFQRLTGCRPSEVCTLRPCDVDSSADVWIYRPASHKTEHRAGETDFHRA